MATLENYLRKHRSDPITVAVECVLNTRHIVPPWMYVKSAWKPNNGSGQNIINDWKIVS